MRRLLIIIGTASLVYDLWALFGPTRCPACRHRRTVTERRRDSHRCVWDEAAA